MSLISRPPEKGRVGEGSMTVTPTGRAMPLKFGLATHRMSAPTCPRSGEEKILAPPNPRTSNLT